MSWLCPEEAEVGLGFSQLRLDWLGQTQLEQLCEEQGVGVFPLPSERGNGKT